METGIKEETEKEGERRGERCAQERNTKRAQYHLGEKAAVE